jgi:hypothetical protein
MQKVLKVITLEAVLSINPFCIMPSNSDSGHAKNLANFRVFITRCTYFGAKYNPTNPLLQLAAMTAQANQIDSVLNDLNIAEPVLDLKVSARKMAFAPLNKRVTQSVNSYAASGTQPLLLTRLRELARDIKGERATPKPTPVTNADGSVTEPKTISTSQTSFDMKVENFDRFIKTLKTDPTYQPNEPDLKEAAMLLLYTTIDEANGAVNNAEPPVINARNLRDLLMYGEPNGMVAVAQLGKTYVKSVFGASSPEYRQVSSIRFRRIAKKK